MILGDHCTRNCRFCAVPPGELPPPEAAEADSVAEACSRLQLRYVVITSVTRDDLGDGGAAHFARTIEAVRRRVPAAKIEVLTPDFQGDHAAIDTVLAAGPDVFNHNVETVPRLYETVRPQADYRRSLDVLAYAARGDVVTKSGLMVGLGETDDEVRQVMRDLRGVGCRVLTIGQYLAPSSAHLPVVEFVEPAAFDAWRVRGEAMGFAAVASGPYVRSSYNAEEVFRDTGE
jgi:lipoic acid synthetase